MKKYLKQIIKLSLALAIITIFGVNQVNALPYYDLKFEETSRDIVTGGFEKIGTDLNAQKGNKMTMDIKKSYEPRVNIELNKEEEDAISQVLGPKWRETVQIDKKEEINIKKKKNTYLEVRPVYKEIKGVLIQDYQSWNKKKELSILIPIDVEYEVIKN